MCVGSNNLLYNCAAHYYLRTLLKFFGKHFLTVCPCNLSNCPTSALPISQARTVGRTTEGSTTARQIALYPLTCQQRSQMNSPLIINGIKEHLHRQWIAQSSSTNMKKYRQWPMLLQQQQKALWKDWVLCSGISFLISSSSNELPSFLWLSRLLIWQRSDLSRLIEDCAI